MIRLAVLALLGSLLVASPATAAIGFRVSPRSPTVKDAVTVSWRTDRALKPGYRYHAVLDGGTGPSDCVNQVPKTSERRPRKGKPMSFAFRPSEDRFEAMGAWCAGQATVTVSMIRSKPRNVVPLGTVALRFR